MIDAWPDWPAQLVVLAGPVGSGKSHIASIWAETADAQVVSSAEFSDVSAKLVEQAAAGKNLVLEDMGHQPVDETGFFHLLNTIRSSGSFCLLTSRSWPREWPIELADLKSRLLAAQLVELREPDDELIKKVMAKLFADRQLQVDAHVIEYCVLRMERSLETAARLVAEMDALALARKSLITRAVAGQVLKGLEKS